MSDFTDFLHDVVDDGDGADEGFLAEAIGSVGNLLTPDEPIEAVRTVPIPPEPTPEEEAEEALVAGEPAPSAELEPEPEAEPVRRAFAEDFEAFARSDLDDDGIEDFADDDLDDDGVVNADTDDDDGDGLVDAEDTDTDNDGFLDGTENARIDDDDNLVFDGARRGVAASSIIDAREQDTEIFASSDFDSDGELDFRDDDIDGDGVANARDTDDDDDGIADGADSDVDGDGFRDVTEQAEVVEEGRAVRFTGAAETVAEQAQPKPPRVATAADADEIRRPTSDQDGDGILDSVDTDIDNDGIANDRDSDDDGDDLNDAEDPDLDNNGLIDPSEDTVRAQVEFVDRIAADPVAAIKDAAAAVQDFLDGDDDSFGTGRNRPVHESQVRDATAATGQLASTSDLDNDGKLDFRDDDIDGDGVLNARDGDKDADGLMDTIDSDIDGDGFRDDTEVEAFLEFSRNVPDSALARDD